MNLRVMIVRSELIATFDFIASTQNKIKVMDFAYLKNDILEQPSSFGIMPQPYFQFIKSQRGGMQLLFANYKFNKRYVINSTKVHWQCSFVKRTKCKSRVYGSTVSTELVSNGQEHNHEPPKLRNYNK